MKPSPPLRFLAVVIGGWTIARAAMLGPDWWMAPVAATGAAPPAQARLARAPPTPVPRETVQVSAAPASTPPRRPAAVARPRLAFVAGRAATPVAWRADHAGPERATMRGDGSPPVPPPSPIAGPGPAPGAPRWTLYGWTFVRPGGASGLAPGGTLGGSQAGLRATYRLNRDSERPIALSVRLASPLGRRAGPEAALGIDWRPSRRVPVHFLAERRQRLEREGRSAFGITVYGGVGDAPVGPLRVDAYAQAGIVGTRARDPFGDGALRLSLPLSGARLGAGAWAAAQPGVARLDLGPQASLRLPIAGRNLTVAADWRLRVAGNARPGSGPALTLSSDF